MKNGGDDVAPIRHFSPFQRWWLPERVLSTCRSPPCHSGQATRTVGCQLVTPRSVIARAAHEAPDLLIPAVLWLATPEELRVY